MRHLCLYSFCLASALGATLPAPQAPDAAAWQQRLEDGRAAARRGDHVEADRAYSTALQLCQSSLAGGACLERTLLELGVLRESLGRCDEAATLLLRGIRILESKAGASNVSLSEAWQALGTAYFCQRRFTPAQNAYARAIEFNQKSPSVDASREITLLASLGAAYRHGGNVKLAEEAYSRALALFDQDATADPTTMVFFLNNLGAVRRMAGRYAEAESALLQAVRTLDRLVDSDGVAAAYVWGSLALLYSMRKDYQRALEPYRKSTARISAGAAVWRSDAEEIFEGYAACLRKLGSRVEATKVQSEAAAILNALPRQQPGGLTVDVRDMARTK